MAKPTGGASGGLAPGCIFPLGEFYKLKTPEDLKMQKYKEMCLMI